MKLKIYWLLICLSISSLCMAQKSGNTTKEAALLQRAYQSSSVTLLDSFFRDWQRKAPPLSTAEFDKLNDTVKQAYSVFSVFYNPLDIAATGGSEFGNDIYKQVKYLIVQNKADVYISDHVYYTAADSDAIAVKNIETDVRRQSRKDSLLARGSNGKLSAWALSLYGLNGVYMHMAASANKSKLLYKIKDFRPQVNTADKKAVYLTGTYDTLLNAFLGNQHLKLGQGGIINPARSEGESHKRQKFLENRIKIWYGHWGGYWQLYSYPQATRITFDRQMRYALINCAMIYEGGEVLLKNEAGRWKIIEAKRTWIQ